MDFITVKIQTAAPWQEILIAELASIGFDAFMEEDWGFEATIGEPHFDESALREALASYDLLDKAPYEVVHVPKQNWNALWEQNFQPIAIGNDCYIRAHFHPAQPNYTHELVITPRMSFGTGHHATTSQMIAQQLLLNHQGIDVFDIGCGTGILAIMAAKLGAAHVDACDIEDWSAANALENAAINEVSIHAYEGTATQMLPKQYDLLLANINRNVLLQEMPIYAQLAKTGAHLLLSGFRPEDLPLIKQAATKAGFTWKHHTQEGEWICAALRKE